MEDEWKDLWTEYFIIPQWIDVYNIPHIYIYIGTDTLNVNLYFYFIYFILIFSYIT